MIERSFSFIIPVYNRPGELDELLTSLVEQTFTNFEVIVVDDGSELAGKDVVDKYLTKLNISYFYKNNSGPGQSRNFGCEKAQGNYFIFLDSDCVLPPAYFESVQSSISLDYADAFGGPDMAHRNFSPMQRAINYAMTSFLTTGGIRGGGEKLDKFYPRSFNMGYSRRVYEELKGFSGMRFGEDIDMSIRIIKNGFRTKLIKEASVYHKRRANLKQFFKQVYNSGIARINLYKRYPESLKAVHFLPSLFTMGLVLAFVLSAAVSVYFLTPVLLFTILIFSDSAIKNKSVLIGMWSTLASYCQSIGYGTGFILAFWKRVLLGKDEFSAFNNSFYK